MKKNIEKVQGAETYPAGQQMLIHQGKVLKDATTLGENSVAENSFLVVMLSKVYSLLKLLNYSQKWLAVIRKVMLNFYSSFLTLVRFTWGI